MVICKPKVLVYASNGMFVRYMPGNEALTRFAEGRAFVTIDGKPLCKAHAAGQRRSDAHREKANTKADTQTRNRIEWEEDSC